MILPIYYRTGKSPADQCWRISKTTNPNTNHPIANSKTRGPLKIYKFGGKWVFDLLEKIMESYNNVYLIYTFSSINE